MLFSIFDIDIVIFCRALFRHDAARHYCYCCHAGVTLLILILYAADIADAAIFSLRHTTRHHQRHARYAATLDIER